MPHRTSAREARWRALDGPDVRKPADLAPPAVGAFGAGDGYAAYPGLGSALGPGRVDASLRPTARAVAELAVPQVDAGRLLAPSAAHPIYVRHRVALTTAERDAGARL